MLRVRFSKKSKQAIVNKDEIKNYYELPDVLAIQMFLPDKYTYQIVDESESADICIVGIQHTDNSLLRTNEHNIFLSVENFSVGWSHYQHWNKYGRNNNPLIHTYIYNDVAHPILNQIPAIYLRCKYFQSIYSPESIQNKNVDFHQKKFCLFTSRNIWNSNKQSVVKQLSTLGPIDFLHKYNNVLKDKTCYHSPELLSVYSQYKFVICFENSKTPGYVTEKIFNVFLSGSIPIYDGAPNITDYIIPGSFIGYDENIINNIKNVMSNKELYDSIIAKEKIQNLNYNLYKSI
jgi:hypothetical protein